MSVVAVAQPAATAKWSDLSAELDRWAAAGRVAALWWRDDDAADATPQLHRLLALAGGVPLALAVIPAAARPELAAALGEFPRVAVLQHGWRHATHAAEGSKKSEFPAGRSPRAVAADLAAGWARLKALFGAGALPVLVPPWNRFAAEFAPLLAAAGIAAVSAMAPRREPWMQPDVAAVDVELDLVAWRNGRGFIGAEAALAGLVGALRRRRRGDCAAALGILTHHLVMDAATEAFLARLGERVSSHRAARWADIRERLR